MEELEKAAKLQHDVRMNEINTVQEYSDKQVKQAVIHSREDIVLLASYGDSIIKILKNIRIILLITLILFAIYFGVYFF